MRVEYNEGNIRRNNGDCGMNDKDMYMNLNCTDKIACRTHPYIAAFHQVLIG